MRTQPGPVFQIRINDGRREADPEAVYTLTDSISKLGLLNPITVDQNYTLRGAKNQYTKNAEMLTDTVTVSKKSFADDTAETVRVSPRTVSRKIQLAKNLSSEAKDIVKSGGIGIKNALKISRLAPEQQAEAASKLAAGVIRSVDE